MPITVTQTGNTQNQNRQPSTAKKIVSGAIDVATTLTKWGIEGAGYVADCGIRLADASLRDVKSLAAEFSGSKIQTNVGDFMLKETQKLATSGIKKNKKISIWGVNRLADAAKARL